MIVDVHMHTFPYLGGASGFESADVHMAHLQRSMCFPPQPVRRLRDHAVVEEQTLYDGPTNGLQYLTDVQFRVGKHGRFQWTKDGEEYYVQFLPPSLQEMTSPPDFVVTQMDYVGIDIAVLQNANLYGRLNEYFADCVRQYPDRFIGLAQINEAEGDRPEEIERLRHAVEELGLRGLYYAISGFFVNDYKDNLDDPKFEPLWREIQELEIPIFWELRAAPRPTVEDLLDQFRRFDRWAKQHPEIPSVLVHGFPLRTFLQGENIALPRAILDVMKNPNVYAEILFPIQVGGTWDYPYPQARQLIRQLYDEFGPRQFVWGSDMPNVERFCTYRQSLDHFRNYCDFISKEDMALMLGGNAARLFNLDPNSRSKLSSSL